MKSFTIYIYAAFLALLAFSCADLDEAPKDRIVSSSIFQDQELVLQYLYHIYSSMPCGYGAMAFGTAPHNAINTGMGITDLLDGSTDLLRSRAGWNESNSVIIPGGMSAQWNPHDVWGQRYSAIRKCNHMLVNLAASGFTDDFKNRIAAEVRFLRAYMYSDLVRRYGDVPLIVELQDVNNLEEMQVPRDPVSDIYDFIERELEAIGAEHGGLPSAENLPPSQLGRVTREAALALGGRAMLYAERYEKSAWFSKQVIDRGIFSLVDNYNALFQSKGGETSEVLFEVLYDGVNKGHSADFLYMPFSLDNGWGNQTCPTQELVDSYEMLDGSPFDWSNPQHAANPYENRDKRLQWSIIVDGATFKNTVIRTAYRTTSDGLGMNEGTNTGYILRKFLDETIPFEKLAINYLGSSTSWKEIRYAEVLLNYAEAQNEAVGADESVYNAMEVVRRRAGLGGTLPAGLDQTGMRERIRHERKVELAFEGHRFWDIRRWRIAEELLHGKRFHGIKITENDNVKNYEVFEITTSPVQVFLPKHYLMPINFNELAKNPKLGPNNEGY
ncbi:RagB/SusD family nutrient uptake outer membrane protein [Proteiniphilum sp. X52]|uniref:RagB/SusD family nutrient uptake outer membrane protein n=1 Tax=Proteiniphilum sp. X52 TaxID=2382159 RepID=UPI000F0A3C9D|nr:RagB/SusD family nutrient uptake outer membrane protein [Proteiniphilum sp. X52]RNC63594.1 RagB/SusD family nutrient uptake outer membrane protein [Proteiniphilum sp. X52]